MAATSAEPSCSLGKLGSSTMDPHPQVPIGVRIYTDGRSKVHRQTFLRRFLSEATLGIYVGALEILGVLIILSFFSRAAQVLLLVAASTVFMPARPLWTPFLFNPVFKLWWVVDCSGMLLWYRAAGLLCG